MFEVSDLLHFVAFSTGVDKENVGVDNVKALELLHCLLPHFPCLLLWKKLQNATNHLPQTSQENFLNKFRLWLLRIESECVFPVLPAPSELKELIGLV